MADLVKIRTIERGAVPRRLRKLHTRSARVTWKETGRYFHGQLRDRRFTKQHAIIARYANRKPGYIARKRREMGHDRPLEFTGQTRRAVRSMTQSFTPRGTRLRYSGARKLNFRHPKSRVRAAIEFRTITSPEGFELSRFWSKRYGDLMNADTTTTTR